MENAKRIFESILKFNAEEINTIFALGALYEKTGEKDRAIEKYEKVIDIIEKLNGDENKTTIDKLNKMISNIKSGISNDNSTVLENQSNQGENQAQNVELIGPSPVQESGSQSDPAPEAIVPALPTE
jgi:lipopolysaccharide biosynthesis regulator YciM